MLIPPPPPPGWLDGRAGLARAAAILIAAALVGLAIGAAENTTRHPTSIGAQP